MSIEIEEQIKQRQEEGNALFYPAKMIALTLGTKHPKKHGSIMIYRYGIGTEAFTINYDTYAPNLSIYDEQSNSVLNFHLGKITRFISGPWVEILKTIAKPVLRKIEREKVVKKREEEQKRLEAWGLS